MKDIFAQFGLAPNILLAGFFGALLLVKKYKKKLLDNLLTLVTGSFTAGYLAPVLTQIVSIKSEEIQSFVGFLCGFGSIRIADWLLNKYFKKEDKNCNGDV